MELGLSTKILGVGARAMRFVVEESSVRSRSGEKKPQIPPLRCAPVGMTILRAALSSGICSAGGRVTAGPLRCAPVGMTILRAALSSGICSAGAEGNRRSLHCAALRSG
jgi:hypothetical protein